MNSVTIHADVFKLRVQGFYKVCILGLVHGFGDSGLRFSNSKLAALFSVDIRSVERAISSLKKDGFIRDIGTGKNDRCLVFVTDKLTGNTTDKTTGSTYRQFNRYAPDKSTGSVSRQIDRYCTDKTTGKIPAHSGGNTDKSTDHKYIREEEEEYKDFFGLWNSRKNLPPVRSVTAHRKEKLSARMNEKLFADNWRQIIDKVSASDFCTGSNDRGWKADIDWLLKNSNNYAKVLEGKYDNRTKASASKLFTPQQEQAFLDAHAYLPTESEAEQLMKKAGLL